MIHRRTVLFVLALAACATEASAAELSACVTGPTGRPIPDAAVVVEGATVDPRMPRPLAAIEQIDRDFVPFLTIVRQGTEIEFPNRDPLKHHVYSFSAAKPFEIKLYAGKPAAPVLFDKTGDIAIGCNIHDWMEAYVLVVESPYFAKTGPDGCAKIADLPAGRHRLRLWHPLQRQAVAERPLVLDGADSIRIDATMEVSPRTARRKPPADKDDY
ncbi:methylamine utilization protein [Paramagnetospirillum kuznetsovii]|uniref:Methylamine utilization protein n=1 Tax=Paramagnetospirillum kuznetsovii TaxID=2053833 RepID=A0A364P355_9PROT|nr:methylamine utilization protein [Paramagnetospirillum kuznetsovii]RAU23731.1 methylamine utilization protein [Paramagnetospirillum kuznetsovii]